MKKLMLIVLIIITPLLLKAPPITTYYKDLRTHLYWLEQEELRKERELNKFLLHLEIRESSRDWKIINRYGYMGLYQFGNDALRTIGLGHITTRKFRDSPNIFPISLQKTAVKRLLYYNLKLLKPYTKYIGCTINNVYITKSGLLAAAHLGGAGNVMTFLNSEGDVNFKDGNGTEVSSYLKEFSHYNF